LVSGETIFIEKKSKPLSKLQPITNGNRALDDGNFLMNDNEKEEILAQYPQAERLIKPVVGAAEFLRGINKWCLWIEEKDLDLANSIPPIKKRIDKVREYRLKRDVTSQNNPADYPHQFLKMKMAKEHVLFLPTVSSERREYIPCGFLNKETIVIDPNFAIYDPETFLFGIISSKMHMVWMRTVAGRLKTDYRYSSTLVYNTFPFPNISQKQKDAITELVWGVLDEREKHSEKTLAQLYDPNKMPEGLQKAHHALDTAIEQCYRPKPFESDEERLEYLFKMYEEMTSKEKTL
jgi:hypothetical protein